MTEKSPAILVVEDTDYIRDLVARMLKKAGIPEPLQAATGAEGIAKAGAERVDLVLCDIGLPDMKGTDVVRQIRAANPALPCIMLTGSNDRESVLAARDAGAVAYLVKPVSPRELETKIRTVLGRRSAAA